jgi:hypothetical protein
MAAWEDTEEELQEQVWFLVDDGESAKLNVLLGKHPELDVDKFKYGPFDGEDEDEKKALDVALLKGHTECARLLINHKADANARDGRGNQPLHAAATNDLLTCVELLVQSGAGVNSPSSVGFTPLMLSVNRRLTVAQYLLDHKADVHYRVPEENLRGNEDALYRAMRTIATHNGSAFAFLSCNADAKNVEIDYSLTAAIRDTHIGQYKHVQAYIDEYHGLLMRVLSERVEVDTRVGLTQNGIYQEPLERTLKYLGLSMSKDQVVNNSIDGEEGVR